MGCNVPGSSVHGVSRQEYWRGLPFPPLGDLPVPGVKPTSPALAGRFFTTDAPGKPSGQPQLTGTLFLLWFMREPLGPSLLLSPHPLIFPTSFPIFLIHLTVTAVTVKGMLTFLFFFLFHSTVTLCLQVSVLIIIPSLTSQPSDLYLSNAAATAKSLQSCLTLCDPIDDLLPGSSLPGILQARTLEWVAISFSNAWKWKMKGKSLSRVWLFATPY